MELPQHIPKNPMKAKQRVVYVYDPEVPNHHYGSGHPMKPQRMRLTDSLISSFNLEITKVKPHLATAEEMISYHSSKYIHFLQTKTQTTSYKILDEFNLADYGDCPLFPGIFRFCQASTGASLDCARRLCCDASDICINWAGGLHHARKNEGAGFCYVNDIVIAILELLKRFKRVLYIDIDVHHGDGVEEAFYHSDRVFTLSFHRYGEDFFPGTGALDDVGVGAGLNCTANFPLKDGLTDDQFKSIFEPVVDEIMKYFDPEAIVLQCGADSLIGDRLGSFCLSVKGHSTCVEYIKKLKKPLLVLGGGGYTVSNVSRCWFYETALLVDQVDVVESAGYKIPESDPFYAYYKPEFTLDLVYRAMPMNANVEEVLEKNKQTILKRIRDLKSPPSVQMQEIPVYEVPEVKEDDP
eukprot:maker-scaffold_5-snap-gene-5.51-mRNA-1 protein AED:0.01 eAED:0.01 QI:285/1/1/1/1/1/3/105/409